MPHPKHKEMKCGLLLTVMEGAILVVDPIMLQVKQDQIVNARYNIDWVAYKDSILYFCTFFNVKSIKQVSIDSLEPLPDLELQLPLHLNSLNKLCPVGSL